MKKYIVIVICAVVAFISIILFLWNEVDILSGFRKLSSSETINSGKFSDFGSFFGGFIGTIVASLGFWYVLKSYSHQIFQQDLETVTRIIEQLRKLADKIEFEKEEISLSKAVKRTNENVDHDANKEEYYNILNNYFIEHYSLDSDTPRVKREFSHFFRLFESIVEVIQSIKDENNKKRVMTLFLATFSDSEIKMISYYYYLFRDKIFPNTKSIVKESKILEGDVFIELKFSDDFSHNYDPRLPKNDFEKQIQKRKISSRD